MTNKNEILILSAKLDDIPTLVSHYCRMFKEICILQKLGTNAKELKKMGENYKKKLQAELKNGTCKAWLVKNKNTIFASGAISIISMVPVPNDSFFKVVYLHSIFTVKKFRKKGFASQIVKEAISYCKSKRIKRMILNSSNEGKFVYEKIGFQLSDNSMRLWIKARNNNGI